MMKHEFERLYGREVSWSVYNALERQYMADESTKEDFVKRCKRGHVVETVAMELLAQAEAENKKVGEQLARAERKLEYVLDSFDAQCGQIRKALQNTRWYVNA